MSSVRSIVPILVLAFPSWAVASKRMSAVCKTSVAMKEVGDGFENWINESFHCNLVSPEDALASATYSATMDETGWDTFEATVTAENQSEEPVMSAASAGFLEGTLMAERISDFLFNQLSAYIVNGTVDYSQLGDLFNWEMKQEAWVASQLAIAAVFDSEEARVWSQVEILYAQLAGVASGLAASGVNLYGLSGWRAAMSVNLMGEYYDVLLSIDPTKRPKWQSMTSSQYAVELLKNDHCSAFVAVGNFNEDLFTGHNMWWDFSALMPVFKTFVWGEDTTVQMTSFPGTLSSVDDFYSLSSVHQKLVVMETTNNIFRTELYDLLKPETLWTWVRVMAANRLASSGREWIDVFSKHNSGTYNNMWLVVDYKRFVPSAPILENSGLLWVAEQMPGMVEAHDQSERLSFGHFPSYNQAYFEKTQVYSGAHENDLYWRKTKNVTSQNYQMDNRAFLFREYGHLAQTLEGGQTLLRWNKFQTDPMVVNNPDLYSARVPSVYGSLASRGDLNPESDLGIGPVNSVATNAVLVSGSLLEAGTVLAVAGPTHDDQEVFKWSTAPPSIQEVGHQGAPDSWNFTWETFQVNRA